MLYWPGTPSAGGVPGLDKVVHVLVFAAVALAGRRAGVPVRWLAVLLLGHAAVSEAVQHALLPGRSGDPGDLVADAVGTLGGLVAPWPRRASARADAAP